ncbi:MAG: CoA transferase [Rhodospirillales bacterium]|nr:CoA transferase [Rhodospirillales bacterium]
MTALDPTARCPLDGVRILDLSRLVAGNMLSVVLADFGAEVIKVESPTEGDSLRAWRVGGVSTHWKAYGRNKKSLALDMRHGESRAILKRLIPSLQVLIENFRPGTMEAMGLGPKDLFALNPGLIIVRISGFGQDGPYRDRPGFGTLIEAMSGLASMTGFPDREPVLPPMPLADSVAGLYGATAVMIALRSIEVNGGRGQVIDLSLFDPLFSILGPQAANYRMTGEVKQRTGSRSTNAGPRNVYRTKDGGWLAISASMQSMVERLFRSIGRADLITDARFRTNSLRVKNAPELDAILAVPIGEKTLAENLAFFEAAEVTAGPVYDISQIIADPHVQARNVIVEIPDSEMGMAPIHGVTPRLSENPGAIRRAAPAIGENTRDILTDAGFTEAEIARLAEAGAIAFSQIKPRAKAS